MIVYVIITALLVLASIVCVALAARPTELRRDESTRLHSELGPAISYRWPARGEYFWHGVPVPAYLIEHPERITLEDVDDERNQELKQIKLRRFGFDRYLDAHKGGNKPIRGEHAVLWRFIVANQETLVLLEVTNPRPELDGTVKRYLLRVPPQFHDPDEALAWTWGMDKQKYQPFVQT